MVTAEAALALPVLVLVLASAVAAVAVLGAQLRCIDAAREGVLAAARGEDAATVRALVEDTAPSGAVPWSVRLGASAVARPEPGPAGSP